MTKALLVCTAALIAGSFTAPLAGQKPTSAPTWTGEVGPLLARSCMNCHRPSQVAPMSLLTYEEARDWAPLIKIMVEERIMPPWHADPRHGDFGNDRRLSDQEIATIARWVDAGAPRGEGEFTPPEFADGWLFAGVAGPPDYVFEFDVPFQIPATGPDVYADVEVQTTHQEDIWVQAVEVRGNSRVVHHSGVNVIRPDGSRDPTGRLAAYTPGKQWDRFPTGSAKLIPAGSKLVFGMHYNTTGAPETDRHRVGVWLARDTINYTIYSTVAADGALKIPPYEPNYESRAEHIFQQDSEITLMKPHMHWRGKDMLYRVVHENGAVDTLLHVPRYDMNWQISYELAKPFPVKAGSKLEVISHFDNSAQNPWNPDPTVQVVWGQESRDEMMEGWFDYRVRRDEPVIPENRRRQPVRGGRAGGDADPVGIWNLKTSLLADKPTKGVRASLLKVEEESGRLSAQITSIRNTFLDVQEFRVTGDQMFVRFGAYAYDLQIEGDQISGTVTSPAGTQQVEGLRQSSMLFVGETPEPFSSTRVGTIGHRTSFAPPPDEPDPVEWLRSRIRSPSDFALIVRDGVAVTFTNPEAFADQLLGYAGKRVDFTGTWVGDKLRIEGIALEGEGHGH